MATNFPGSIDAFTRPSQTDQMDDAGVEGDVVIDNIYDAIEAVEAELGTDPAGAQATVKARLAAMDVGLGRIFVWRSTDYLTNHYTTTNLSGTQLNMSANTAYYFPLYIPYSVTVDRIAIQISSWSAGANARLGIYASNSTDGSPTDLIVDCGEIDCSSGGVKELTISQSLSAGLHWVTVLSETATVGYSTTNEPLAGISLSATTSRSQRSYLYVSRTYTSGLESAAPALGSMTLGADVQPPPVFWLRRT